ncbi:MAG: hypothetical protein ABWW65_02255 [Thermoprotei archaeon]
MNSHGQTPVSKVFVYKGIDPEKIIGKINLLLSDYIADLYHYNSLIKNSEYYLKPVHIVIKRKPNGERIKYYYYGRYWYRIVRANGNIKWIYLGKKKPDLKLPDPPQNPLEGLVVKISSNQVEIISSNKELYDKLKNVLKSLT